MPIQRLVLSILLLLSSRVLAAEAQSLAHDRSAHAVIDPVYDSRSANPSPMVREEGAPWIYGAGELESWRLRLLMARKDSAELRVRYPGVYHTPYPRASYRLFLHEPVDAPSITFRAVGSGTLLVNGLPVASIDATGAPQTVATGAAGGIREIRFDLASETDPPALLIEEGAFSTADRNWQWKGGNGVWERAFPFPQTVAGVPPHRQENPSFTIRPVGSENRLYDFGRELLAHVVVRSRERPAIVVGESETEALDVDNEVREQSTAMDSLGGGLWRSRVPLALRYVYLPGETPVEELYGEALTYPTAYRGAFASSDSTLTRIWMNSAYTLRVNMHDFLLDGIKRDRLPWTGDLTMSTYANAYAFHEPELVRRSLVALNNRGIAESDVNGIVDYSLAWIIAQDAYQLYFGDPLHLEHEWGRIRETIDLLLARTDEDGFLDPEDRWVFIDWVDQEKWTALQVYWWWAQRSAIRLAERVGDVATAERLRATSEALRANLHRVAWDEQRQAWRSGMQPGSEVTRHPNFLAVVSGLAAPDQHAGILRLLQDPGIAPVGTPYMAGFENMAVSRMGDIETMLDNVTAYWGAMLDRGATTFWEAYDATHKGAEQYAFYGRPYAKSLAHAWSAGPAAFLPAAIFGLEPLEDGWREFSVDPNLGSLEWASVAVPTQYGAITVDADRDRVLISVPAGTVLRWNGRAIHGPAVLDEAYR